MKQVLVCSRRISFSSYCFIVVSFSLVDHLPLVDTLCLEVGMVGVGFDTVGVGLDMVEVGLDMVGGFGKTMVDLVQGIVVVAVAVGLQ